MRFPVRAASTEPLNPPTSQGVVAWRRPGARGLAEHSPGLPFPSPPSPQPHELLHCPPQQLSGSRPSPCSPTAQPGRGRGTVHPGVCIQLLLATAGCIGLCRAGEGRLCPPLPPTPFHARDWMRVKRTWERSWLGTRHICSVLGLD